MNDLRTSGKRAVALITNMVPYHHARWNAFAAECASLQSLHLLRIVSGDSFRILSHEPLHPAYHSEHLFDGTSWSGIPPAALEERMFRRLGEISPSVVFLNGYAARFNWIALRWCRSHGVPAVICSESNEFDEPRNSIKEEVKRFFVSRCASGLAGGAPQADYLRKLGLPETRIFTGYDVVDNAHFENGAASARARPDAFRAKLTLPPDYFFACARFEKKKNIPALVRAFSLYRAAVEKHRPGFPHSQVCDLVIAGEGKERVEVERAIEESGMTGRVHLAGAVSYRELPFYYGLARAFIHASSTEQWGLVVNEAMAAGLPILASRRCGCVSDLVGHGMNGLTFDPDDIAAISSAMHEVMQDQETLLRMGRESRRIISEWSPSRFAAGACGAMETASVSTPVRLGIPERIILRMMSRR